MQPPGGPRVICASISDALTATTGGAGTGAGDLEDLPSFCGGSFSIILIVSRKFFKAVLIPNINSLAYSKMVTKHFKIERWDAIIYASDMAPRPALYIVPDIEFLNHAQENNYKVRVNIANTNSKYDGIIEGTVYASSNVPNCRPNYFAATGEYVVILNGSWLGYPPNDGHCAFLNRYRERFEKTEPVTQTDESKVDEKEEECASEHKLLDDVMSLLQRKSDEEVSLDRDIADLVTRIGLDADNGVYKRRSTPTPTQSPGVPKGVLADAQVSGTSTQNSGGMNTATKVALGVTGGILGVLVLIGVFQASR